MLQRLSCSIVKSSVFARHFSDSAVRVRPSSAYKTVSYLDSPARDVWLIGTAHISDVSTKEVMQIAASARPDVVFVELCEGRARRLRDSGAEPPDLKKVLNDVLSSDDALGSKLVQGVMQGWQAVIGHAFGLRPGAELLAALHAADELGAKIVLGDQEIDSTMPKLKEALRTDWPSLLGAPMPDSLHTALGPDPHEAVERLRDREVIRELKSALQERAPNVMQVLLHDRDKILADRLLACPGRQTEEGKTRRCRIVAVVGAAHMDGIEERWLAQT